MNTDIEILNKILANKIQQYIIRIPPKDQVSFFTWMQQAWFNIEKLINIIQMSFNGYTGKETMVHSMQYYLVIKRNKMGES